MKIFSFNVNGLRARLHQMSALIDKHSPDIICLQETWCSDPLPLSPTFAAYTEISCGFSGIGKGLKVLHEPSAHVLRSHVISPRILCVELPGVSILNCYAPQKKLDRCLQKSVCRFATRRANAPFRQKCAYCCCWRL